MQSGGTLAGTDSVEVTGTFDWTGGNLTFQNGASLVNNDTMNVNGSGLFQPFAGGFLVNVYDFSEALNWEDE